MEANGVGRAVKGHECLEKNERQVSACGIASEDDLVGWYGLVERARGRVKEREVCSEGVDEGGRERVLRRKTVSDGEDGGAGQAR